MKVALHPDTVGLCLKSARGKARMILVKRVDTAWREAVVVERVGIYYVVYALKRWSVSGRELRHLKHPTNYVVVSHSMEYSSSRPRPERGSLPRTKLF